MQARKVGARAISENALALTSGWQLIGVSPGSLATPKELACVPSSDWFVATVPGTVAQSMAAIDRWGFDSPINFDDQDWWYRCFFDVDQKDQGLSLLHFGGLATLADAWLNGEKILSSDNMFAEHSIDVTQLLSESNELVICFKSLTSELKVKRPRPQWKTNLVNHQQLRFIRTTLLGRIPGWTPLVAAVGPWRSISLEHVPPISVAEFNINAATSDGVGCVDVSCEVLLLEEQEDLIAELSVSGNISQLNIEKREGRFFLSGRLEIENVALWWPHTHGEPVLHQCDITIKSPKQEMRIDCGRIGFRSVVLSDPAGDFDLSINGRKVFCRGACWTVSDIVSLAADVDVLAHYLQLAVDAGMNMIRIGGTMLYESEEFYRLCDELGIMVWQDFMFANMDYPIADEHFRQSVEQEVGQQLRRWQTHPSITIYCGNSEVEQQAAMLGFPKEYWRSELFSELLPQLCQHWHPAVPYVSSTPSGGVLPFHTGSGVTHYYGVGAYLRPLSDVKSAGVRFTSECLGFSNVPEQSTINKCMGELTAVTHHPKWKSRVPRDTGASWDFEDVREHYLQELFGVEVEKLRYSDSERYFELSRVVTGEVMSRVFSQWRAEDNQCQGGLVWFYKDIWPGAGWGIVDSEGLPKACYYYLKRVWAPLAVVITDEGLDGLAVHVFNDGLSSFDGRLDLRMIADGQTIVANITKELTVPPGGSIAMSVDELLGVFYDVSYAYRFGPPKHDVVVATLSAGEKVISEALYYPIAREPVQLSHPVVNADARAVDESYELVIESDTFLQAVHFDVAGYLPNDNYFCLVPGVPRTVVLSPYGERPKRFRCYVDALNLKQTIKVNVI